MRLAARAWQLREQARQALCDGDRAAEALAWAEAACQLQATPRGLRLLALALLANGRTTQAVSLIERLREEAGSGLPGSTATPGGAIVANPGPILPALRKAHHMEAGMTEKRSRWQG